MLGSVAACSENEAEVHDTSGGAGRKDPWFLSEGRIDSRPAIVRGREFLDPARPETHSHFLAIAWEYGGDPVSFMPNDHDSRRMGELEDRLVPALEHDGTCVLFAVVTCNGRREWKFYCKDVSAAQDVIDHTLPLEPRLLLNLRTEADPEWREYTHLLQDCARHGPS